METASALPGAPASGVLHRVVGWMPGTAIRIRRIPTPPSVLKPALWLITPLLLFALVLPIPLFFLSIGNPVQTHWLGYLLPLAIALPLVLLLARNRRVLPHLYWTYMAERAEHVTIDWKEGEIQRWIGSHLQVYPLEDAQEILIRDMEQTGALGRQKTLLMWREVLLRLVGDNHYLVLFSTEPMRIVQVRGEEGEVERAFLEDSPDHRLARHFTVNLGRALARALALPCTEETLY